MDYRVSIQFAQSSAKTWPMRVTVLHDTPASGWQATMFFDRLAGYFADDLEFGLQCYGFDKLRIHSGAEAVWAQALEADLLVVALARDEGIPPEVADWLQEWAVFRRGAEQALLVLSDGAPGRPDPAASSLEEVWVWARRHGVNCLEAWNLETALACWRIAADLPPRRQTAIADLPRTMADAGNLCSRW
jgi:hypothetical protein